MVFTSWTFAAFAAVVLPLYYLLSFRWQNRMLLAASGLFYGAWDWRFLGLLLASTSVDYWVGARIAASRRESERLGLLWFSIAVNLGVLAFFKYFDFFSDGLADLLALAGVAVPRWHLDVVLPVGISFYTFHALSYSIDIYRGRVAPAVSFADYLLFVLFFPQLVAGPIARAAALLPQVSAPRTVRAVQLAAGAWLILWGYFKKMVVADNLAGPVDAAFRPGADPTGPEAVLACYAFAFQIYGDFSGYTDIARGLAKLMGFELALNFRLPYLATNPREFWQRWHISLSSWLRDYLYIPLGGGWCGGLMTARNLMLTMLIGGLWHGAAWHFIAWGGYHGLLLVVHRWVAPVLPDPAGRLGAAWAAVRIVIMFHLTCFGWLLFRAECWVQIGGFVAAATGGPFSLTPRAIDLGVALLVFALPMAVVDVWIGEADDPRGGLWWATGFGPILVGLLVVALAVASGPGGQQFLYFQF